VHLDFKDIALKDVNAFMAHWELTEQRSSDYCFPILWGWALDYGYQAATDPSTGLFWIRQTTPDVYNLAPIGSWQRDYWEELIRENYGDDPEFWLVPEKLLDIWKKQFGDKITAEEDRGNWEYIYNIKDLAELAGGKYVKKRNRVNQFRRRYDYVYEPITPDIVPAVREFQQQWVEENAGSYLPGIEQESNCIMRILNSWGDVPHLRGGVIKVAGRIVAYTIGELAVDDILVHFEKACLEYNAGFQVINKEFLTHMLEEHPELRIVNREEDLNDLGLRESKMSYLPVGFIKKYHVKINFLG
jgi:hypothetical protein